MKNAWKLQPDSDSYEEFCEDSSFHLIAPGSLSEGGLIWSVAYEHHFASACHFVHSRKSA